MEQGFMEKITYDQKCLHSDPKSKGRTTLMIVRVPE